MANLRDRWALSNKFDASTLEYANDLSISELIIANILIKFVKPKLCKESRLLTIFRAFSYQSL